MIERLRRNAELTLLLMGIAVFGGAFALAALAALALPELKDKALDETV